MIGVGGGILTLDEMAPDWEDKEEMLALALTRMIRIESSAKALIPVTVWRLKDDLLKKADGNKQANSAALELGRIFGFFTPDLIYGPLFITAREEGKTLMAGTADVVKKLYTAGIAQLCGVFQSAFDHRQLGLAVERLSTSVSTARLPQLHARVEGFALRARVEGCALRASVEETARVRPGLHRPRRLLSTKDTCVEDVVHKESMDAMAATPDQVQTRSDRTNDMIAAAKAERDTEAARRLETTRALSASDVEAKCVGECACARCGQHAKLVWDSSAYVRGTCNSCAVSFPPLYAPLP